MKTFEHAKEAIQHSEQLSEIAHCEDTAENHETLLAESDGHHSGNGLEDYWADDPDSEDKMLWRVNVETPDN